MTSNRTKRLPFAPVVSIRRMSALLQRSREDLERIAGHAGRYYDPFDRQRRDGGKWRHIDNPMGELKTIQSRIYRAVLATYEFPPNVMGGLRGRSIKDNMRPHLGQPLLVTLDIKGCFPGFMISDMSFPRCVSWGFRPRLRLSSRN